MVVAPAVTLAIAGATGCGAPQAQPTSQPALVEVAHASSTGPEPLTPGDHDIRVHHGGMRHDFSDVEHWVARFEGPERDAWQLPAHVVERLAITPGMTVVDLGAGTGYFLPWLQAAVGDQGSVFALDVEPTMVDHMNARAAEHGWSNVTARRIPYESPELSPGSVDRVLIVDTWHHIGDRGAYAAELAAALRPGGGVYIVDFTQQTEHGPPPAHRLTEEQVVAELAAGGLVAEVLAEDLPEQYIVVGRLP